MQIRSLTAALACGAAAGLSSASGRAPPVEASRADAVRVLEEEVRDLQGRTNALQDDKQAMVHTVQQLLRTNQTEVLQRQVAEVSRLKVSVEERCARERTSLEARAKQAIEAEGAAKEVTRSLQEQNVGLQSSLEQVRSELAQAKKRQIALEADKRHLLEAMHGLLRQNTEYVKHHDCQPRAAVAPAVPEKAAGPNVRAKFLRKTTAQRQREIAEKLKEDPVAHMADTSAMNAYVARAGGLAAAAPGGGLASVAEAPETAEAQEVDAAPKLNASSVESRNLLRWLAGGRDRPARARRGGTAPSPLDVLAAEAAPPVPAPTPNQDEDAAVNRLLDQAEAELGPAGTDADLTAAAAQN